jgi:hypothetical protein
MGKRARLVCIKLCQAYGSPGAGLCVPPNVSLDGYSSSSGANSTLLSVAQSWSFPVGHVRARGLRLSALDCGELAAALPSLPALTCEAINHACTGCEFVDSPDSIAPRTCVTKLCVEEAYADLRSITTFAPNLRSLEVGRFNASTAFMFEPGNPLLTDCRPSWTGAVTTLRSLQHVHLPVAVDCLGSPAFACALQRLTGLTHVGLDFQLGAAPVAALATQDGLRITQALAALPLVASVKLDGAFRVLGGSLGRALQALRLRKLELFERWFTEDVDGEGLSGVAGCLPNITAMPELEHMTVAGVRLAGSVELLQACSGGSSSLQSLALHWVHVNEAPLACDVLACLTALTSLSLRFNNYRDFLVQGTMRPAHSARLARAVQQQTKLQHLALWADLHDFAALATLPALTSLDFRLTAGRSLPAPVLDSYLELLASLGSLRKLALDGCFHGRGHLVQCVEGLRKLPLLQELELPSIEWSEEVVRALLPPPEQLKKVAVRIQLSERCDGVCELQQTLSEIYGVELAIWW